MRILKIAVALAGIVLVVLIVAAPVGPMPGVFIGGTDTPVPETWPDTRSVDEIRLQVGEGLIPRVVIIWVIQVDGDLHVVGAKGGGWTSMIGAGAPVRLRLGDETFSLWAEPVTSDWQPILEAYVDKYRPGYPDIVAGFPTVEEAAETISVFRLIRAG